MTGWTLSDAVLPGRSLSALTESADPSDLKLYIKGPGEASIEMSAEGAESTHHRGFSASPGFLKELTRLALEDVAARRRAIISGLVTLGVESDE
jgi:hypothetical protein